MATSRTGTSEWKRLRAKALRLAQANGITHCPTCRVELDYMQGLKANSAEADHIVPHSLGGRDTLENTQILCRRCNQSKGNFGLYVHIKEKRPGNPGLYGWDCCSPFRKMCTSASAS